jgi:peptidoglycan/LPS O-acetylase OafA/YrhL
MQYRREIDGLRAIAVLPVILFHAGVEIFSGGFVGVDVFFVISGYVITAKLMRDLEAGRFSIGSFYEGRARRILPALFFVLACCIPFAYFWMSPSQLADFAQSVIATILSASNIHFWHESGYFEPSVLTKPLLHTWSLGVEEQFYIFFPLLLSAVWSRGQKPAFLIIVALTAFSFLLSEWGSTNATSANFYWLPFRAWELGAGAICAFVLKGAPPADRPALAMLGFGMIIASIFLYTEAIPFPSFYALLPVLGAALIILYATPRAWAGWLLSSPAFVGVGLISYSAYLWHQPLFAFARLRSVAAPSIGLMLALCVVTMVLAVLSWRYVEQPFRHGGRLNGLSRRKVFVGSAAVGVAFLTMGAAGHLTKGAPSRDAPNGIAWRDLGVDARLKANSGLGPGCIDRNDVAGIIANPNCRTKEKPEILLWGDSFAMQLTRAFQSSGLSDRHGLIQMTSSRCSPIVNFGKTGLGSTPKQCIAFNDQVVSYIKQGGLKYVFMASPFVLEDRPIYDRSNALVPNPDNSYALAKMTETAEIIRQAGAVPVFVMPPPASGADLSQCLTSAYVRNLPLRTCDYPVSKITKQRRSAYALMGKLGSHYRTVDFRPSLCADGICKAGVDQVFLYRDEAHLSVEGAEYLGRHSDVLAKALVP